MSVVRYAMCRLGLLTALLVLTPLPAFADTASPPPASPSASAKPSADVRARDGGVYEGRVSAIDLAHGTLELDAPGHGKVNIALPPSVSVMGKDAAYRTVTDLVRGTPVQVYTSEKAGHLTAQIIKLR